MIKLFCYIGKYDEVIEGSFSCDFHIIFPESRFVLYPHKNPFVKLSVKPICDFHLGDL